MICIYKWKSNNYKKSKTKNKLKLLKFILMIYTPKLKKYNKNNNKKKMNKKKSLLII